MSKPHKSKTMPAPAPSSQLEKDAALNELKNNESALLAAIVQSSDDAIIGKSLDGTILVWNEGAGKLFGYSPEEVVGKHISILYPPGRMHENEMLHKKLRYGEVVEHHETQRQRKDGSLVDISLTISPIKTSTGTIVGSASISHDITRRKQSQVILEREKGVQALLKQLEEQKVALENSNDELQRFAYVAAHDLKEPLRTIVSYTNLLAKENKGNLSKESEENMRFIVDAGKRMQHLIGDLLAYSRVETQAKSPVPVSCNDIFELTVATLQPDIDEAKGKITRDDLPSVYADPSQVEQLFLNLLGNGLKFRGSEPPRIHVSVTQDNDYWLFCVKDNGIGIDMKFADRIFQMFQRLHSIGEYPGTGIGLAICKKIVERHTGSICVESQPGHGSAFYFSLPAVPEESKS